MEERKPLEELIDQVRKFRMDGVAWEYRVIDVIDNNAIVRMKRVDDTEKSLITLSWGRGELNNHGFEC